MKMNKKGMSLVECIVAMGVFAVATTGFTMAASACVRAQAKSHKRNLATNVQTTNLEHFSNYKQVVNLSEYNVKPMDNDPTSVNSYVITYTFPSVEFKNTKVFGYRSTVADGEDGVFELSFLSPVSHVDLEDNEYWITLYNCSTVDEAWDISCSSDFHFFDTEKNSKGQSLTVNNMIATQDYIVFGIADDRPASQIVPNDPNGITFYIDDPIDGNHYEVPIEDYLDISSEDNSDDRYGYIFYTGGSTFETYADYVGS